MTSTNALTWEAAVRQFREQATHRQMVEACFYDDPLLGAAQRFHASTEWSATRQLIGPPNGRALDIGAGRGIASFALGKDGWAVTALEPDPSDLVGAGAIRALSAEAGLNIDVAQTWGEQLPFEDGSFALVYCRQVLHHAKDLAQLCREIARVLRPGGVLLAVREHVISKPQDLQAFLDGHPLHNLYGGEHAYQLSEYKAAIQGAGLLLTQTLNPYASDINLYPQTRDAIKRNWAQRLHLPTAALVPDAALSWAGFRIDAPGRLFSFVAQKPGAA
jgi:SAM-dependent methyltransferase